MKSDLPHHRDRLPRPSRLARPPALGEDNEFLLGTKPSLADFAAYHPLWFLGSTVVSAFPTASYEAILPWLERMTTIGHGSSTEILGEEALTIAKAATPETAVHRGPGRSERPQAR